MDDAFEGEVDAAHFAARVVMADLSDRRGIRQELNEWDNDVKEELVSDVAAVIRTHWRQEPPSAIAKMVVREVMGRGGLDNVFDSFDDDVVQEIYDTLASLMADAFLEHPLPAPERDADGTR